ncbi:EscR/YscR/HrcR family type III secretion system export apparatus protein [Pantoea cypripedii]|jgi:type III secretion system export apparatus protein|uniref:EscR/YscR/HrcR family type III secretion system export apparatus protein n=1 Tax=Pantoea cypripedii TaxID=55209 RepID=A0A6B9G8P0_PANCY|nr:EscR/YscR/HrcR family type III secretion system export apparatus protein [Pantoea cypripedii]QGY32193.1 EscR/YscR/HrcR family type III secretion system export apparatus protein [Pantoea cypripedii]
MNDAALILTLSLAATLPFLIAGGTCFIKFSIVFALVRNALGIQQIPSNLTLNGLALILTLFVMVPVVKPVITWVDNNPVSYSDAASLQGLMNEGTKSYRDYLTRFADPALTTYFTNIWQKRDKEAAPATGSAYEQPEPSIFALLPAYALTEIKDAFEIGFYIYLPFIVIDILVSNILLALGMMMMSPVTISLPIKLVLFVAVDGWAKVVKGTLTKYLEMS